MRELEIICGDITKLEVDAIVNAARPSLLGGGGVDGAIHTAAGSNLVAACRALSQSSPGVRCQTGEARITPGYDLKAKWIIHTVGPVWSKTDPEADGQLLTRCYANCISLAASEHIASIAFPAISTGAYGFPMDLAAKIAVREMRHGLAQYARLKRVIACCFDDETAEAYKRACHLPG